MGHRRTCGKCTSYRALQAWGLICYSFSVLRLSLFLYETEAVTHLSHRISARIENRKKKKESFCICQASCQSPYICHLTLVIPWMWHGSWCSEKLSNLVHYSENSRAEMGTWCVHSSSRVLSPPHDAKWMSECQACSSFSCSIMTSLSPTPTNSLIRWSGWWWGGSLLHTALIQTKFYPVTSDPTC